MIEESPPSTVVTSYITFERGLADLAKTQEHLRVSSVVFLLVLLSLISFSVFILFFDKCTHYTAPSGLGLTYVDQAGLEQSRPAV